MLSEINQLIGHVRIQPWLRLVRPHHWAKNLLVFVPALASFLIFDSHIIVMTLVAFLAFCFAASSGYILNDLVDRSADQNHPQKALRPLASGAVTVKMSLLMCGLLLAVALVIAYTVGLEFFVLMTAYLFLTTAYSLALKRVFLVDVVVLATLIVMRVLAGAAATDIPISFWLIAFLMPLFISLALIKRCAELVYVKQIGRTTLPGRSYSSGHLPSLWIIGICSAVTAVVMFGLFVSDAKALERYATPDLLWAVTAFLSAWIASLWVATYRGQMGSDPLLYVLNKRETVCYIAIIIGLTLLAQVVEI
ncbi:UbiA family prenyltransferase [Luminiphilus sp.]|nr:UbiA family prenyltransferase [Luminiphilus sp.]